VDWWQVVLIILVSIIIGLLAGYLLSYLIVTLILKKPFTMPFIKRAMAPTTEEQLKFTTPDLFIELIKKPVAVEQLTREQTRRAAEEARKTREVEEETKKEAERLAKEQARRIAEEARETREAEERVGKEALAAEGPLESIMPGIVAEIESNYRIASEPWTGQLLSFQTGVWDVSPNKVNALPADLQEDLTQAYADIRLANSIVWLSTELGRRSSNLDENYTKLCISITTRFERIVPLLKQSGS